MESLSRSTLYVKLSTVWFLIPLALLTITGCYLYFPDVRLDSDVKANPSGYACSPYKAHPLAALFRSCGTPVEAISLVPTPYASPSTDGEYPVEAYRDDKQLRSALAYAEYAKDQYLAAKAQSADLPAPLASFLIPLGGAALGLGMTGNSGAPVTALGLAGATTLGLGSLLQNKDREKVYITGAEGVQCLLNNMAPFTHTQGQDLRDLDDDVNDLAQESSDLDVLIAAVSATRLEDCNAKLSRAKLLKAAELASKAAKDTVKIASDFLETAENSPVTIVYTVDKINTSVSSEIINTEPDVKSLSANLKDVIPDKANNLAGIPTAKKGADESAKRTPPAGQVTGNTPTVFPGFR
jgi:hypothetical protein